MDMLRFSMKDVMFNLVVENIFTAPFQRFQTSQAVGVKDAQCTAMDIATIHNEAQVEGKPLEDPPCQGDGGEEDEYNGRLAYIRFDDCLKADTKDLYETTLSIFNQIETKTQIQTKRVNGINF